MTENINLKGETIQSNFDFIDETQDKSDETQVYTDKELMVQKEYELYIDSTNINHSDENLKIFKGAWDLCETYMTQVLRYAMANAKDLQN